ncbi:MAG TPA: hypothetical protein VF679_09265, partial [Pedobacter sp.]
FSDKKAKYINKFQQQMYNGIDYYRNLITDIDPILNLWNEEQINKFEAVADHFRRLFKAEPQAN